MYRVERKVYNIYATVCTLFYQYFVRLRAYHCVAIGMLMLPIICFVAYTFCVMDSARSLTYIHKTYDRIENIVGNEPESVWLFVATFVVLAAVDVIFFPFTCHLI